MNAISSIFKIEIAVKADGFCWVSFYRYYQGETTVNLFRRPTLASLRRAHRAQIELIMRSVDD